MKYLLFIVLSWVSLCPFSSTGQAIGNFIDDESDLYASTKQVNQFFRRFNGEEDTKGERLYSGDKDYRNLELRKLYLDNLFDKENSLLTSAITNEFKNDVLNPGNPVYLDFHGGKWFAEVTAKFLYLGAEKFLTLFLELEKDTIGSKWVITNVYFEPFARVFADQDSIRNSGQKFLHPMSHEIDFMNLVKSFESKESLEHYLAWKYRPDYLTLFVYEFKKGDLAFKTITRVKFHFFQVDGWYFELSDFNREGYNSGWLISSLAKITREEKELLLKFINHE